MFIMTNLKRENIIKFSGSKQIKSPTKSQNNSNTRRIKIKLK